MQILRHRICMVTVAVGERGAKASKHCVRLNDIQLTKFSTSESEANMPSNTVFSEVQNTPLTR